MAVYPPKIRKLFESTKFVGVDAEANAAGTGASFLCGSYLKFSLRIDTEEKTVIAALYTTNGCGFMTAAGEALAEWVKGRKLTDLHGAVASTLVGVTEAAIGTPDEGRGHCFETAADALRAAFADHRARVAADFRGETALICTCFGVSEDTIERCIVENGPETVEDVTDLCRAGGGCGSCRMLIQELLDIHHRGL